MLLRRVQQQLPSLPLADLPGAIDEQMRLIFPDTARLAGLRIGVTAGSRGIARIDEVVIRAVAWLKMHNARPFVIPAMGSHGGATSAGQEAVLRHYGITTETVGAPILSSMDTVEIGHEDGLTAYWSRVAFESDGVLLLNRVKPHTGFVGLKTESGLLKMSAVGLGKEAGATAIHSNEARLGMERAIRIVFNAAMATGKILGGLALVEDGHHQLTAAVGLRPERLLEGEAVLLRRADALMARLPFPSADVVHVGMMGKDISGSGMDPNIIGKHPGGYRLRDLPRKKMTTIGQVSASDLTDASEGNATGVAFADAVSERLNAKIDMNKTRVNCAASHALELAVVPTVVANDRELMELALRQAGAHPDRALVACIRSTLHLGVMYVTPALADTLDPDSRCEVGDPFGLVYGDDGYLRLAF